MTPEKVSLDYVELDASKMKVGDQRRRRNAEEAVRRAEIALRHRRAAARLAHPRQGRQEGGRRCAEGGAREGRRHRQGSEVRQGFRGARESRLRRSRFEGPGRRSRLARKGRHRSGVRKRAVRDEEGRHLRSGEVGRGLSHHPAARHEAGKGEAVRGSEDRTCQANISKANASANTATCPAGSPMRSIRIRRRSTPPRSSSDLPVQKTGLFARTGGDGIAANPERAQGRVLRTPCWPKAMRPIRSKSARTISWSIQRRSAREGGAEAARSGARRHPQDARRPADRQGRARARRHVVRAAQQGRVARQDRRRTKLKVEDAEGHRPQCRRMSIASSSTPRSSSTVRRVASPRTARSALANDDVRAGRADVP